MMDVNQGAVEKVESGKVSAKDATAQSRRADAETGGGFRDGDKVMSARIGDDFMMKCATQAGTHSSFTAGGVERAATVQAKFGVGQKRSSSHAGQ